MMILFLKFLPIFLQHRTRAGLFTIVIVIIVGDPAPLPLRVGLDISATEVFCQVLYA